MDSNDVQFIAVDNPHATRFTLHILAAVAEHEAAQISTRTKMALAAARARGKTLGGWRPNRRTGEARMPPGAFQAAATAATKAKADERAARVLPIARQLRLDGMSLRRIAAELTERHVATPRGGPWSAASVHNLLQRPIGS
jgi:DNA invertase Pin-like site-specific DNA recombinase